MLLNTPEFRKNDAADLWQDWNFRISINDSLKAIAGVEYLRGMPGQKHVVLVTGC